MTKKQFRKELFYLLHEVTIQIKPVRAPVAALSKTIQKYFNKYTSIYQVDKQLSDHLFHELLHMEWSGNHLEIKNLMERLVVQTETTIVTKDDLPPAYRKHDTSLETLELEGN